MVSLKIIFLMAVLMAASATAQSTIRSEEQTLDINSDNDEDATPDEKFGLSLAENQDTYSSQGTNRLLAQKPIRSAMKCDKFPRVCRAKGSPGPDCCKTKCVNVMKDEMNCGMCGGKCRYREICCKGKCVNPLINKNHCGGCNIKCKKGNACVFGMCNYA
ncbi:hypothetical protein K2173_001254 [Erythroxylum novogranatense]|uniref:Stigma-specific STIG1-like protein 1 n=1 Tax=Erythroxylum novogranatense TaxID=1862640 RepID=A0AAV8T4S1_9ROSI|nr:hypothetical protein K2173_001254 [Erythroxylum novogranatense]